MDAITAIVHRHFRIPKWLMADYPDRDEGENDRDFEDGDHLAQTPLEH